MKNIIALMVAALFGLGFTSTSFAQEKKVEVKKEQVAKKADKKSENKKAKKAKKAKKVEVKK